jgi:hypothetical protein
MGNWNKIPQPKIKLEMVDTYEVISNSLTIMSLIEYVAKNQMVVGARI